MLGPTSPPRIFALQWSSDVSDGIQRFVQVRDSVVTTARTRPDESSKAEFVPGDLSSRSGARTVAEAALEILGGIDIVVNNVGGTRVYPAGITAIEDDQWQAALDLNYLSAVWVNGP